MGVVKRNVNLSKVALGRATGKYTDRPVMLSEFEELFDGLVPNIIIDNITDILYEDLKNLKTLSQLVPGMVYKITDRFNYQSGGTTIPNPTYLGNDRGLVYIKALTVNTFSINAIRVMALPKSYSALINATVSIGVWNPLKTVSAGNLTLKGNNVFVNVTGNIGGGSGENILDAPDWTYQNKATSPYYEDKQFVVKYDFDNDWFIEQSDWKGNIVTPIIGITDTGDGVSNPCDFTDWNCEGIRNNKTVNGLYNNSLLAGTEEVLSIKNNSSNLLANCIIDDSQAAIGISDNINCSYIINCTSNYIARNTNCNIQNLNNKDAICSGNINCYIILPNLNHGDIKNNKDYDGDVNTFNYISLQDPTGLIVYSLINNILHNDGTLKGFILDISGDTTLDVEEMMSAYDSGQPHSGITEASIIYLTASNATRSITDILNWRTPTNYISNKKIRFNVEPGLIVTFVHGTGTDNPRCEGGASAVIDGDTGDWIEFELYNGVIKQSNIGTY